MWFSSWLAQDAGCDTSGDLRNQPRTAGGYSTGKYKQHRVKDGLDVQTARKTKAHWHSNT